MYRIFIVEDDETIAKMVAKHLEKWDYEVWTVKDFSNVMTEFVDFDPQLILMDIRLPFFNGYHWCTEIRNVSKVPIIFLSSVADNMNIVMAVSMGADDFIAKPFDLEVLTVKIQALLRRSYDFAGSSSVIEHKGVMFQVNDGTITYLSLIHIYKRETDVHKCCVDGGNSGVYESDCDNVYGTGKFIFGNRFFRKTQCGFHYNLYVYPNDLYSRYAIYFDCRNGE